MQKFANWLRRDEKGITLIELLVVGTILALLGAVAIPRILAAQTNAKTNAALANKGTIEAAVEQYYILKSSYPASLATNADDAAITTWLDGLEIKNGASMVSKFTITYTLTGVGATATYAVGVTPK